MFEVYDIKDLLQLYYRYPTLLSILKSTAEAPTVPEPAQHPAFC